MFAPRTAIKPHVLLDFLAELSFSETISAGEAIPSPTEGVAWIMTVDRAVNSKGVGVGITITLPPDSMGSLKYEA